MKASLSDAIDDYIAHRKSRGIAVATIRNEQAVLRRLLQSAGNLYVENIHEGHIDTYFRQVSDQRSQASQGVDTTTLRGFFAWAIRTRRAGRNQNPMSDRKAPRFMPRTWRGFTVDKVPALLDAAGNPRDRILLATGCYTLGRSEEFRRLRLVDVRLQTSELSYVIPKTYKVDILPISAEYDTELRRWLAWYASQCGTLDPNWYLIPRLSRPKTSGYRSVDLDTQRLIPTAPIGNTHLIAQKALVGIGFPLVDEHGKSTREGMHTIRRSMARALYEQLRDEGDPAPIETVRAMLNHATEKQTRQYIGLESEREHRDARLKGKQMFPGLQGSNVLHLQDRWREAQ